MPANFLVVDDHPLFLEALRLSLGSAFPNTRIAEATSIAKAITMIDESEAFDLVLLDLSMPGTSGFDGLLELRTLYPKLPVVICSALEDSRIIQEAIRHGASGFISKSVRRAELAAAIEEVMAGNVYLPASYNPAENAEVDSELAQRLASLTPQQLRVLKMLRQGMLNKQIAYELSVGETTVKAHVSEILRKLNVASRTQAVIEVSKIDFDRILSGAESDGRTGV
ncbi:MAG: response regulator transcription factor [Hyphomicrobiaceae bacterium]|nr:response regulator transcription factor [Hyphomicrobiaceae bacterium]